MGKITMILLFVSIFFGFPCLANYDILNIRDSTVWIRGGSGDSVRIEWEDWYAGDRSVNYIYFQGPDGTLLNRIFIDYNDPGGMVEYPLDAGTGDYRVECPGYFFRRARITAIGNAKLIFEPPKGHFCYHAQALPLYFDVPAGTSSFYLCGKYFNGVTAIQLYRPDGQFHDTLTLITNSTTLYFDRLEVMNPDPGTWRIEFNTPDRVGFWLDGVDNYFSPSTDSLFTPESLQGSATFTGSGLMGTKGLIGAFLVNLTAPQTVFDNMQYMGLETYNYYSNIMWREPYNSSFPDGGDNGDPDTFNWPWFVWDDARISYYRNDLNAQVSTLFDSKDSWLDIPLSSQKQDEFAEFALAYLIHANEDMGYGMKWFAPWDEPNLSVFTYPEYESLLQKMAARIKDPGNPAEVLSTKLLAVSTSGWENVTTASDRLGMVWAENLYIGYDNLVDGIAFDYWEFRDLIESWRFGNAVDDAANIIETYDTDGQTDEEIVINQTSMCFGSNSSQYDVDTHFGALWLTGAVCSAFSNAKIDAFQYFTTVDDTRHMKGLMYSDQLPTPLPYQPQPQPFELKPIGHAMAMINEIALDEILILDSDSLEVDALLTVDSSYTSFGMIIVNKTNRVNALEVTSSIPFEMRNKRYLVQGKLLGPDMTLPEALPDPFEIIVQNNLDFNYLLQPETVYVFQISETEIDVPSLSRKSILILIVLFGVFLISRRVRFRNSQMGQLRPD
jgi:hypothetical protein